MAVPMGLALVKRGPFVSDLIIALSPMTIIVLVIFIHPVHLLTKRGNCYINSFITWLHSICTNIANIAHGAHKKMISLRKYS